MRQAWILLALTLCAGAQSLPESETARARRLLESPQWRDKAWGAYFTGRLATDELKESLIEAFRGASALHDAKPWTEESGYLAALFDAAIQSGITVPAELLEPYEENWTTPVIILLARDPSAESSLLRLREGTPEPVQWLAVNNLLLVLKSQPLFSRTLSEVEISHVFDLRDPGDNSGHGGGTGGGICGDGVLFMPKGFPPIGIYRLTDSGMAGDVLLARGPEDAYYRRFVVPTDAQKGFGLCRGFFDRQKIRIGYLAMLLQLPEQQVENLFQSPTVIEFRSDDDLRRQWDAALTAQEAAIRSFVRTAQANGMGSVTGMTLKIVPQVEDRRKTTAGPTPPLTSRAFVLE
jgi:hypothetical protein